MRDVHFVLSFVFQKNDQERGVRGEREWMYEPLSSKAFTAALQKLIEEKRGLPLSEGGLGRPIPSSSQKMRNRIVFDLIKEIIAERNELTFTYYPKGIFKEESLRVGCKNERLAISLSNFLSSVESKVLQSLFPKREGIAFLEGEKVGMQREEYGEALACQDAAEELQRAYLQADLIAEVPEVVSAVKGFIRPAIESDKEIARLCAMHPAAMPPEVEARIRELLELKRAHMNGAFEALEQIMGAAEGRERAEVCGSASTVRDGSGLPSELGRSAEGSPSSSISGFSESSLLLELTSLPIP
jgi:hypothetical protein